METQCNFRLHFFPTRKNSIDNQVLVIIILLIGSFNILLVRIIRFNYNQFFGYVTYVRLFCLSIYRFDMLVLFRLVLFLNSVFSFFFISSPLNQIKSDIKKTLKFVVYCTYARSPTKNSVIFSNYLFYFLIKKQKSKKPWLFLNLLSVLRGLHT